MPKRALPVRRPDIELDINAAEPLYKQLYERLRAAILAGQLERGARLPSTRTLAAELGVSRSTTALAYEMLLLEGYLEGHVGRGTLVADQLPEPGHRRLTDPPQTAAPARIGGNARAVMAAMRARRVTGRAGDAFRGGEPALDLFPYDIWARLLARRARRSLEGRAFYQSANGYKPLREAIAAHIGITRGVRCLPEQIIITSGSQGALDLAARTLLDPGDPVWVEDPGYFGARGALIAAGAQLVPVPVDAHGLDVNEGRARCPEARLASTTPSHQFPTTVTMSLSRRLALLDWAAEAGAWVLEDDYDSEYRFSGRPLEALQGLDRAGRVIYIGTFSKVLFPALRLGYLAAPLPLIEPLMKMKQYIDSYSPILDQMALADFMREGHYARHLRRMLGQYARRRDLLVAELAAHLGGLLEVHAPEAGMHLVGWLPPGVDDRLASDLAAQAGVHVSPISENSLGPLARGGLLFGYSGTSEDTIREGVRRLAGALSQAAETWC